MTIELLTWLALGLAAVCFGGEALVKGASSLSRRLGMRPLLIGILVVAFASDSPELAPAIRAAESGYSHLALGTLLGSTIFTILFVLGGCSLLLPARVSYRLVRQDVPILLGAAILLLLLSFDGRLSALDGLLLLACLAVFIVFLIVRSESEREETKRAYDHEYRQEFPEQGRDLKTALFFLLGLGLLWLGSVALVEATIEIGHGIGVTDLVMGLTILGIGTSTPETASAVTSILRGEREIAIGHLVGSSIFTLLGGLGLAALFAEGGLDIPPSALRLDIPVLIAAAAGCLPVFLLGRLLPRWGGAIFLTVYIAYVSYLVMNATRHATEPISARTTAFFLVALALPALVMVLRSLVLGRAGSQGGGSLSDEAE